MVNWVTYGLVGTDGVDLGAEHHRGEDEEEEALKAQEYEEDDCCWRREGTALWGNGREVDTGKWKGKEEIHRGTAALLSKNCCIQLQLYSDDAKLWSQRVWA